MKINDNLIEFETMRSSGPGGQHANRRNTGVRLRISLEDLPLDDSEIQFLKENLPTKNLTSGDEIIVENAETRSQAQNKSKAKTNLKQIIEQAIQRGHRDVKEKQHKERTSGSGGGSSSGSGENVKEKRKRKHRSETTDDLLEQAYEQDPESMERFIDENQDSEETDD